MTAKKHAVVATGILVVVMAVPLMVPPSVADVLDDSTGVCTVDFEDEDPLDVPSAESPCHSGHNQIGTGASIVTTSQARTGTQSWKPLEGSAKASTLQLETGIVDETSEIEFWFYPDYNTGVGETFIGFYTDTVASISCSATSFVGIKLDISMNIVAHVCSGGAAPAIFTMGAATAQGWNHIKIQVINLNGGEYRFSSSTLETAAILDAANSFPMNDFGRYDSSSGGDETQKIYIDDIAINGLTPALEVVGAAASVAVPDGIAGFDVDGSGTTAIARLQNGHVAVYGGQSLGQVNSVETSCDRLDGVAAVDTHVSYLDCDGTGTPTHLRIRANTLGSAQPPGACAGFVGDVSFSDFGGSESTPVETLEQLQEMAAVDSYLFDFGNCSDAGGVKESSVVWGFSTFTGRVGAAGILYVNNWPDDEKLVSQQFDPTASPTVNQLCSWSAPNGDKLVAAATQNGNTKVYRLDIDAAGGSQTMSLSITQVASLSGAFGNGIGLACAGDLLFIETADSVRMVDRNTATQLWSVPATTIGRGVAMSGDAKWVFWYDGGKVFAGHAGNGTIVGEVAVPTDAGSWVEIEAEDLGQNAWIVTLQGISRFETWEITTGTPLGSSNPGAGVPGAASGELQDQIGNGASVLAVQFGTTVLVAKIFLGALVVGALAFGGAGSLPKAPAIGAGIGGIIGLVMALGMGLLGLEFIFGLAVIAAAGLFFAFHRGSSS